MEEVVTGGLELCGDLVGDFDLADEGEVVAIALVGDVDDGAVFEAFEGFVFPDVFVEDGVVDKVIIMSATGAESGGGGEGVKLVGDFGARLVEGGEHGAADIGGVRGGNDGIVDGNDPADGDVGGGGSGGAGIGHDGTAPDHGGAQKLGHFLADFGEVRFFFLGFGTNGLAKGEGLLAHFETRRRVAEFAFEELEKVFSAHDATGLQGGDHVEHVVDLRSGLVAGFDEIFGIHDAGRKCDQSLIWCLFLMNWVMGIAGGLTGCRRSLSPASRGVRSALRLLTLRSERTQFSQEVGPPRELG